MKYNTCYLCHKAEETRPYGDGGQPICFPCMKASPEREAVAERNFAALLNANGALSGGAVVIGGEDGPQPVHRQ